MSIYGKLFTETKSIAVDDICNEMNIVCAEFSGYNSFLDDFVNESSVEFVNEGVGETIKAIFEKIKNTISSILKSIKDFFSGLFGSKQKKEEEKLDKLGEECSKKTKELKKALDQSGGNTSGKSQEQTKKDEERMNKAYKSVGTLYDFPKMFKDIFDMSDQQIKGLEQSTNEMKKSISSMNLLDLKMRYEDEFDMDKNDKENFGKLSSSNNINDFASTMIGFNFDKEKYLILKNGTLDGFLKLDESKRKSLLTNIKYYRESSEKYTKRIQKVLQDFLKITMDLEKKIYKNDDKDKMTVTKNFSKIISKGTGSTTKLLPFFTKYLKQFENQRKRLVTAMKIADGDFKAKFERELETNAPLVI